MRLRILLAGALLVGFLLHCCNADETRSLTPQRPALSPHWPVAADTIATVTDVRLPHIAAEAEATRTRIGRLERKRLGLTRGNIRRMINELETAGRLDPDIPELTAFEVFEEVLERNAAELAKVKAVSSERDWEAFLDAIFAIIEKLIELFERFEWLSSAAYGMPAWHDPPPTLQLAA